MQAALSPASGARCSTSYRRLRGGLSFRLAIAPSAGKPRSAGRGQLSCTARVAPPPPAARTTLRGRESEGSTFSQWAAESTAPPHIGGFIVDPSWLHHAWRLGDPTLEQLRRQLGMGDRWAWQDEGDAAEFLSEEEEEEEEDVVDELGAAEDGAHTAEANGSAARRPAPVVRSLRGPQQRRSSGQRHCRGRVLAGAAASAQGWRHNPLPEELQACTPGQRLSAQQEEQLGALIQAAKQAAAAEIQSRRQAQQLPGQRSLAPGGSAELPQQAQQGQRTEAELRAVVRRGEAAWQLLHSCNVPLVAHVQRRLTGGKSLPGSKHKELFLAGLDALSRAVSGYQPGREARFSTYAGAAIQNAMADVLFSWDHPAVAVSRDAHGWAQRVRRAARRLASREQLEQLAAGGAARQQERRLEQQPGMSAPQHQERQQHVGRAAQHALHDPPQQGPASRLERLAGAARLRPRQALLGLAAARRHRTASSQCRVQVEGVAGCHKTGMLMAPFWDVQEEEDGIGLEAQQIVEELLSRLPAGKWQQTYRRVLLLRFGLTGDDQSAGGKEAAAVAAAAAGRNGEVDFASVGRQLGVSRPRAQQLYRSAVTEAQRTGCALGML